jgi:hypothetical protein
MKVIVERFKNWKTTLIGVIVASIITGGGIWAEGETNLEIIISAAITAGIGVLLKDPNKMKENNN